MKRTLLALPLLLAAACAPSFHAPAPAELEAFAAHSGVASWQALAASERVLVLRGESATMGREASFTLWVAGDGRYRLVVDGELGSEEVFDGSAVYRRDFSEVGRELEGPERERAPHLVWMLTGGWVSAVAGVAEDGRVELAMGERRDGLVLERDAAGRPARVRTPDGTTTLVLAGWRTPSEARPSDALADLHFPARIESYSSRTGELDARFVTRSAALEPLDAATFAYTLERPDDARFTGPAPAVVELRRLATGHLVVPVALDGGVERVFLFDTGAGATVIDARLAEELGCEALGKVNAVGVSGVAAARFVRANELAVGSFVWDAPVLVALDFQGVAEVLGAPVVGVLGFDFIARAQVELDAAELRVWPPDHALTASAPGEPAWLPVPLALHDKVPAVRGRFPVGPNGAKSASGWFRLDTGDNGSVTFHGPAVKEHALLAGRETQPMSFGGVGGSSFGYSSMLEWFELGTDGEPALRIGPLEAGFAVQSEGTFASADLTGNVGQGVLARFDVRLDYKRRQMALRPRPPEPPVEADARP